MNGQKGPRPNRGLFVGLMLGLAAIASADSWKLPLAFEPNRGQGDQASQYLARGACMSPTCRETDVLRRRPRLQDGMQPGYHQE